MFGVFSSVKRAQGHALKSRLYFRNIATWKTLWINTSTNLKEYIQCDDTRKKVHVHVLNVLSIGFFLVHLIWTVAHGAHLYPSKGSKNWFLVYKFSQPPVATEPAPSSLKTTTCPLGGLCIQVPEHRALWSDQTSSANGLSVPRAANGPGWSTLVRPQTLAIFTTNRGKRTNQIPYNALISPKYNGGTKLKTRSYSKRCQN